MSSKRMHQRASNRSFYRMIVLIILLTAVCLANQELLQEAKQYPLQTQTGLSKEELSKYCFFGSTARYKIGQSFTPHLIPGGYDICITCTCNADSNVTCDKEKCDQCVNTLLPKARIKCCKKCLESKTRKSCTHESITYSHNSVWRSLSPYDTALKENECEECSCINGEVTCAFRICPVTNCKTPQSQKGTCCKFCKGSSSPTVPALKGCWSMGRMYNERETWHPILSPRDHPVRCVYCTCINNVVRCQRVFCPELKCDVAVREKTTDCCLKCPDDASKKTEVLPTTVEPKAVTLPAGSKDCIYYNKVYENKKSFHPDVKPFGIQYCFNCTCYNTVVQCGRVNCSEKCKNAAGGGGGYSKCCKDCLGEVKNKIESTKTQSKRFRRLDCSTPKSEPVSVFRYIRSRTSTQSKRKDKIAMKDSNKNTVHLRVWTLSENENIITTSQSLTTNEFRKMSTDDHGSYQFLGRISREKVKKIDELSSKLSMCTSSCRHKLNDVLNKVVKMTRLPMNCRLSEAKILLALSKLKED